jgi:hypothetical protein
MPMHPLVRGGSSNLPDLGSSLIRQQLHGI